MEKPVFARCILLVHPFIFQTRIYVTGFIKAAAGGTLKWSGKEEKIAVDGRFVLEKVPFGKQKWEVLMPDGTAYQLVWKLERKKKEPVSFVFRENSPFKIRVGKQIRAIELVLTLKKVHSFRTLHTGRLLIKSRRYTYQRV